MLRNWRQKKIISVTLRKEKKIKNSLKSSTFVCLWYLFLVMNFFFFVHCFQSFFQFKLSLLFLLFVVFLFGFSLCTWCSCARDWNAVETKLFSSNFFLDFYDFFSKQKIQLNCLNINVNNDFPFGNENSRERNFETRNNDWNE